MALRGLVQRDLQVEEFDACRIGLEGIVSSRVFLYLLHLPLCFSFPYALDLGLGEFRCTLGLYTENDVATRDYWRFVEVLRTGGRIAFVEGDPWVVRATGERVAGPFYRYGQKE